MNRVDMKMHLVHAMICLFLVITLLCFFHAMSGSTVREENEKKTTIILHLLSLLFS